MPNIRYWQWIRPCVCRDTDAWTFLVLILVEEVQNNERGTIII